MKPLVVMIAAMVLMVVGIGGQSMEKSQTPEAEREAVRQVIENSIGWAATKDTSLLYSCFAHDTDLFYFSPRDNGTVSGFDEFKRLTESFFLPEEFKAAGFEIRDLQIQIARSGDVAWYHARLDDFNTWKGQVANWEDVRWTGVLEKRDGVWVIVQMHFSDAVK